MAGKVTVGLASHWPCVTDFSGLSIYGLNGLRQGDEHPAYTPLRSMATDTHRLSPIGQIGLDPGMYTTSDTEAITEAFMYKKLISR